jgi:HAE1 family hydrophobic/amphiphilic exporter-1
LKPRAERKASADQVISRLRAKFSSVPGATLFLQATQDLNVGGRLSRTQYQYTLLDPDLEELNDWAPKLLGRLQALPQLRDVASDQQTNSTMLSLAIDRDQAARFGIQPSLIDQTLDDAFGQRQVTQYFTQLNTYHVILEITPELQADPGILSKIYIKSPISGQQIPLSTFVKFDTQQVSFLSINHQAQFPVVTLSFNLGMLYESYIHPLTILSTLPSAGVGALLMLLAFHFDLSVIALIGIILLIGIVKKNGIMMVDFAIQAEREQHLSPEQSIRQACLLRFRPIMMTTMAALLASLPLMLGHGTGSEIRQPLGYSMVGGLLLSQALTLFTTPVIYLYLDRVNNRLGRNRVEAIASAMPAPPASDLP